MHVIVTPKAEKQYKHLPKPEQAKIKKKLYALENDPLSGKKLSGELSKLRSIKVWPYRIIYFLDYQNNKISIVSIIHRQGAY